MEEVILKPNIGGARKIARKLLKDADIKEIPVSLQKVLDYLKTQHDVDVVKFDFGEKVSGILVKLGDTTTIGFNANHAWVRRRFTIAHEVGHLLMGHTCDGEEKNSNKEIEANQFAAELLVPLAFIKRDFIQDSNLDNLSKKYIVSKEALCRHLMECKVL